jgi:hypothetical protein
MRETQPNFERRFLVNNEPFIMQRGTAVANAASRRTFLGACALIAAAAPIKSSRADVHAKLDQETIRRWYGIWDTTKDWQQADAMLAEDFTFSSAAGDDHLSKAQFKKTCWDTQVNHIDRTDLMHICISGDAAFVMYTMHTKKGKSLKNVEYLEFEGKQLRSIECYFGAPDNYPTAVNARQAK